MMYPLLLSAFMGLTVMFERIFSFYRQFHTPSDLVQQILQKTKSGKLEDAKELCKSKVTPVSSVLSVGIDHFRNSFDEMEIAMKNEAESWIPKLERRIEILDTVTTAAPLMGLLGTITGMMASFRILSEKGINEPNAITGGVAEALIATATGISIALLCLVGYNYLTTRVKFFIYDIESAASKLVEARMAGERVNTKT